MAFTTLIEVPALMDLAASSNVAVIDCRFDLSNPQTGRSAYLAGHIPGALYAHLNEDLSAPISVNSGRHPLPAPREFAATLQRFGIANDTQVIAYDEANGSFAARLWWMLKWVGHQSVAVLNGGLKAWIEAGAPLERGDPVAANSAKIPANARFLPNPQNDSVLSAEELGDWALDTRHLLIDARAPERFSGSVEPIDTVAGHIAGAVNHPFNTNLGRDGRFLPAAELRLLWERRLAGRSPQDVAAMCGSGVTACHNLLSLEVAGLRGAKLYPGSWSEWIRDPKRPVARGS
jgi:thiosulfate/3-mercaptopyruvate sulfurtransferase